MRFSFLKYLYYAMYFFFHKKRSFSVAKKSSTTYMVRLKSHENYVHRLNKVRHEKMKFPHFNWINPLGIQKTHCFFVTAKNYDSLHTLLNEIAR